ncbi:unnamed protein product [Dovyalis caffra]|uniref:Uncharacterized protein n=1 Tax=Dovyalis caffra TaxID=77055 RepID=A0AAV1S4S6_9ROSI|nr:unnamed protein product [Dovyalis caffra]
MAITGGSDPNPVSITIEPHSHNQNHNNASHSQINTPTTTAPPTTAAVTTERIVTKGLSHGRLLCYSDKKATGKTRE